MLTPRWALEAFGELLMSFRIVMVGGALQVGKTTLVKAASLSHPRYVALDDRATFEAVRLKPGHVVRRTSGETVVFDEGQRLWSLIGEMKYQVDRDPARGQYVLVCSTDYRRLPETNESLAGRVADLRLRSLTEAEQRHRLPGFLSSLLKGCLPRKTTYPCSQRLIGEAAIRGGFPEVVALPSGHARTAWFQTYLRKAIIPSVRSQWKMRKAASFETVLKACARQGAFLKKAQIASETAMAWPTVSHYVDVAEAMYLIDCVDSKWMRGMGRFAKTSKRYFSDSGLLANLLNVRDVNELLKPSRQAQKKLKHLLETWVYNQLACEVDLYPTWRIEHLRTRSHEVDFVITNERGRLVGIEVKAGEKISNEDFRHLKWLQDQYGKDNFTGVILYTGQRVRTDGHGNVALPMSALWDDFSTWEVPQ